MLIDQTAYSLWLILPYKPCELGRVFNLFSISSLVAVASRIQLLLTPSSRLRVCFQSLLRYLWGSPQVSWNSSLPIQQCHCPWVNMRLTAERSFTVTSWGPMLKYAAMQQVLSFNFMWRLQQGTLELNPLLIFTAWMQCLLVCNTKGFLAINWKTKADCKVHQINQVDTQSSQVGCYLITY
jgi:hypothetical protein